MDLFASSARLSRQFAYPKQIGDKIVTFKHIGRVQRIPERYQIRKSLGLGATSEVFEATRAVDDQELALKVFSSIILNDRESVQRLETEIATLRRLRHPNIVSLLGTHSEPGFFALELELIRGTDLRAWMQPTT